MQANPKLRIASPKDGASRSSLGVPLIVSACLLVGLFAVTIHNAANGASLGSASIAAVSVDARSGSLSPLACPDDAYEVDNTLGAASTLLAGGTPQDHTFGYPLDIDWIRVDNIVTDQTYTAQTFDLTGGADTYMALYDRNANFLTSNDDVDTAKCLEATSEGETSEYCRSVITWVAANTGPYYLRVLTVRFPQGQCPTYRFSVTPPPAVHLPSDVYLPIIIAPPPKPTATSTPVPGPSDTPEPTATPTPTPDPLLLYPNGLAVDSLTHRVYVTSRDNNRLVALDGSTLGELGRVSVGGLPWGVAVNAATNRVYVANWKSQDVYVMDAMKITNAPAQALLDVIPIGDLPTFVRIDPASNRIFVAKYGSSGLAVINGNTNAVEVSVGSGGVGAWGLAFNPTLNRVYIGNRDSGTVTTLDGNNAYQVIGKQTIKPCGGTGSSPYAMDFNPNNHKLYIACSPFHNVNSAAVYTASASGLASSAFLSIGDGGEAGGGGVVVDTATGNAFFTNSRANTVSVIDGAADRVIATVVVGSNPYGIAADPITKRVFVGNRDSHNVTVLLDTYGTP
jgi:YVTN family beta-propeller protein